MKRNPLLFLILLFFPGLLILQSCQRDKDSEISELEQTVNANLAQEGVVMSATSRGSTRSFFPILDINRHIFFRDFNNPPAEAYAQKVYKDLQRQDQASGISKKVIEKIGYPIWDGLYMDTNKGEHNFRLLIPFSKYEERKQVNGLIIVEELAKSGQLRYALIEKSLIVYLINAAPTTENPVIQFSALMLELYDGTLFDHMNTELRGYLSRQSTSTGREDCITYLECNFESHTQDPPASGGGIAYAQVALGIFAFDIQNWWADWWFSCIEMETCWEDEYDFVYSDIYNNDNDAEWTGGLSGGSGGVVPPPGVNANANMTEQEKDAFRERLALWALQNNIPYTIGEGDLFDWISFNYAYDGYTINNAIAIQNLIDNFYDPTISPFMDTYDGLDIIELIEYGVIGNCEITSDFTACAWETLMQTWSEDFLFSQEELDHIQNMEPIELGGKVTVPKKDWSNLTHTQRINHIFVWLSFINRVHKQTFSDNPSNHNVTYNIANDFFDNVTGTGNAYNHTIDLTFKKDGQPITINDVGFSWSRYWDDQNFYWWFHRQDSNSNNAHLLFNRYGTPIDFGNSILDFIVNGNDAEVVETKLGGGM